MPGDFDYAHLKVIHAHTFQDVYDWAGQEGAVAKRGLGGGRREMITVMGIFSGRHFSREIILWAVRWYCTATWRK